MYSAIETKELKAHEGPTETLIAWNETYTRDYYEYFNTVDKSAEEREYQFKRAIVPIPYLGIRYEGIWKEPILFMSGDGERWIRGIFPHIIHGLLDGCMQMGKNTIFEENIVLNLSSFTVNYINPGQILFYQGLFDIDRSTRTTEVTTFMESWSQTSLQDLLAFIAKKTV